MRTKAALLSLLLPAGQLLAQSAENVLLVVNESSQISLRVGQYYMEKRGIPAGNILRLRLPADDSIDRAVYARQIESPIAGWLSRNFAQDRILYFVLTKGIPLRIAGPSGADGPVTSVDCELMLLYKKMTGWSIPPADRLANPYFQGSSQVPGGQIFSHEAFDIYLVTRLDGYTLDDIRGLIERGVAPSREGKIVLDSMGSPRGKSETSIQATADSLKAAGFGNRVLAVWNASTFGDVGSVLGYYAENSNNHGNKARRLRPGFIPGALAAMSVSPDARALVARQIDPNSGVRRDDYVAPFTRFLTAELIREGVTGVVGRVDDTFLEPAVRPSILFPAYLSGFNLAESFYLAMPSLSRQVTVVGDPLCAPFRSRSLTSSEIDPGVDEATELPRYFSNRRLRVMSAADRRNIRIHADTFKLLLRAEARLVKQDKLGARQFLEEALLRDSRLALAQMMLAGIYEQEAEYDKAVECYRRILELFPNSVTALRNLAYVLAVRRGRPAEALPLAEKAYGLSKGAPVVAHILGWIYHLTGDDTTALRFLEDALQSEVQDAELALHAAIVYAALGRSGKATQYLSLALDLDPRISSREEAKSLRSKLRE